MAFQFGKARAPLTRAQQRARDLERRQAVTSSTPRSWRELCHPDLRNLTEMEFEIRSSLFSQLLNGVPQYQKIFWYGALRREFPGGDGGNGMYCTEDQAEVWPYKNTSDITVGPG